jgi:hypothetical protein
MASIYRLMQRAKSGDKEIMEFLIIKFEPIINSLSWKLNNEYGKTDLTIFFIKLIYSIKLDSMVNLSEGALVNYIVKSLKRECYRLNRLQLISDCEMNDNAFVILNDYIEIEHKIFLDELVHNRIINKRQEYVLLKKYYNECTDQEIANELCISRQAVSKMHKLAIKNLKEYLRYNIKTY